MLKTVGLAAAIVLAGLAGGAYWGLSDNNASAQGTAYSDSGQSIDTELPDPPDDYYVNRSGHVVHRPMFSTTRPEGASAQCRDGSYSFSEHRRGTCSYHGGVAQWLR